MLDTHCHIDDSAFDQDREEVILRQKESGVETMIVPGINVASITSVLDVCHAHPGFCFPALGLHPEDVKADWREQLDTIESAIRTHRHELVAIGEIGLDYYWDKTFKEEQQHVLRHQLLLARELDLPVILHNRDATEDILRIVKEVTSTPLTDQSSINIQSSNQSSIVNQSSNRQSSNRQLTGVFHCFSGSKETADIILNMGFYLGIGGVFTFKNSKLPDTLVQLNQSSFSSRLSPLASNLSPLSSCLSPLASRLLLETDAPYMSPVPHRGERNESRFILHVAERLALTLNTTTEQIIATTTSNAKSLFRL